MLRSRTALALGAGTCCVAAFHLVTAAGSRGTVEAAAPSKETPTAKEAPVTTGNAASTSAPKEAGASSGQPPAALSPSEFRGFRVVSSEPVSRNTRLIRLELPSSNHVAGLTVASCIVVRAEIDGKVVQRPYTPISLKTQRGHMDLLIKSYPPPGGIMSRHLHGVRPGGEIEVKGPFKKFDYEANRWKRVGMIAGGTGITPMLQVIREILGNSLDATTVSLVFANVSEQDILLRDELDALAYLFPGRFSVHYTLDQKPTSGRWTGGVGFVSEAQIRAHLPPPGPRPEDVLVLVCGPKGMVEHLAGPRGPKDSQGELQGLLKAVGYDPQSVYKF